MIKSPEELAEPFVDFFIENSVTEIELLTFSSSKQFMYLSDIDTYELLYLSIGEDAASPFSGDYRGKKCYDILQGRTAPCPFCTNHLLKKDSYYIWPFHNDFAGCDYILKDKLIEYKDRFVRMEIAMDVTHEDQLRKILYDTQAGDNMLINSLQHLSGTNTLDTALRNITANLVNFYKADSGYIFLFGDPPICTSSSFDDSYPGPSVVNKISPDMLAKMTDIKMTNRSMYIEDLNKYPDSDIKTFFLDKKIYSLFTKGIINDGIVVGLVGLNNLKAHKTELHLLGPLTNSIGEKLQNVILRKNTMDLYYNDTLTGYLNIEGFKDRLSTLYNRYSDSKPALCSFDIRNFAYINELFGYDVGDQLIIKFANTIASHIERGEAFCRLNGDTFLYFMHYKEEDELRELFDTICEEMKQFEISPEETTSIELFNGVYLFPEDYDISRLNSALDKLTITKRFSQTKSGNCQVFFSDEMLEQEVLEAELLNHLPKAFEDDEFHVFFQPQYNYMTGEIVGAEALARWPHPTLGWISPATFIETFERTGHIYQFDKYIWEKTCRTLRDWIDKYKRTVPLEVAVNISPKDLTEADICETFTRLIKKYDLPPDVLKLEITESTFVKNPKHIARVVEQLREAGFTVIMDDFGAGASSLNSLKNLSFDVLKLDILFLSEEKGTGKRLTQKPIREESAKGRIIVESVIKMAKALKLPVIVEGVETQKQADFIASLGCNCMQGFHFAMPMSAKDFEVFLNDASIAESHVKQSEPQIQ